MTKEEISKLRWQCRRGMLELDLLLGRITTQDLEEMTEKERSLFSYLLTYPDPDLYACLMGSLTLDEPELSAFVRHFRTRYRIQSIE